MAITIITGENPHPGAQSVSSDERSITFDCRTPEQQEADRRRAELVQRAHERWALLMGKLGPRKK